MVSFILKTFWTSDRKEDDQNRYPTHLLCAVWIGRPASHHSCQLPMHVFGGSQRLRPKRLGLRRGSLTRAADHLGVVRSRVSIAADTCRACTDEGAKQRADSVFSRLTELKCTRDALRNFSQWCFLPILRPRSKQQSTVVVVVVVAAEHIIVYRRFKEIEGVNDLT